MLLGLAWVTKRHTFENFRWSKARKIRSGKANDWVYPEKKKGLGNDDASQGGTKSENWMVQEKGRFSKLRWGGSWWNEPEQCQHAPHWMN